MNERPTLNLSADQVRADGGAFLITMPGEPDPSSAGGVRPIPPPSVLVALNQPCPTCDGEGYKYRDQYGAFYGHTIAKAMASVLTKASCPDCGGSGRLVFDLKTPCDLPMCVNGTPGRWEDGDLCGYCQGTRFVSHRVWLDPEWGILPIRDGEVLDLIDIGSGYDGPYPVVTFDPHENALIVYNSGPDEFLARPITLPSAARPGDYVALVKVTAE